MKNGQPYQPYQPASVWSVDGTEPVTIPSGNTAPTTLLPMEADVAIVGGGYTGLGAAYTLAQHGQRVVLCEGRTFGWGASSRNAGMLLTGLSRTYSDIAAQYGSAVARKLFRASLKAVDHAVSLIEREGIACHLHHSGHIVLANRAHHMADLSREATLLQRECSHPVRLLSQTQLAAEIGASCFAGGLLDEASYSVHAAKFVAGLVQATLRAGAVLFEHTPVERIARLRHGFLLSTPRGDVLAQAVIVATNGYTGHLTPSLRRRLVPVGSYSIATEILPDHLAQSISPRNRLFYDTRHIGAYFRLTPDNRLLYGGRDITRPDQDGAIAARAHSLHHELLQVFPQLHGVRIAYAWGGNVCLAFDGLFHAGPLDGIAGLYYAAGYAGHGGALASYTGRVLAERILGIAEDDDLLALPPLPAAPIPYDGDPWFVPLVGSAWKLLDQVGR
ncbi:MAG: FAD-binding oxidoreductase [Chloroflexaceae bacterium]|nr:FAD-binding oxidoreductase [Chloroflexaceae bacterium]